MKRKGSLIALTFGMCLIHLFCVEILPSFARENPKVAALVIQQARWTSDSFKKAEKRLNEVKVGMAENDFLKTMDMRIFKDNDGNMITAAMDGFIMQLGESCGNEKTGIVKTYVFGYVDARNVLTEKYNIVVKNGKIIRKIRLDDYLQDKKFYLDTRAAPAKNDYVHALEYVKNVKPGMWSGEVRRSMHLVGIWSGPNVNHNEVVQPSGGEFFIFGPGYLRDKYFQKESDNDFLQDFVFGYEENGKIVEGFVIHLRNLQVTNVENLR